MGVEEEEEEGGAQGGGGVDDGSGLNLSFAEQVGRSAMEVKGEERQGGRESRQAVHGSCLSW